MDALDIGYRYKADGHEQHGVTYRPRFSLPRYALWLDVTPTLPTVSLVRDARHLATDTGDEVALLIGNCWYSGEPVSYDGWLWWRNQAGQVGWYFGVRWVECLACDWRGLARPDDPCPGCWERAALCMDTPDLIRAYRQAGENSTDEWLRRARSA